MTIRTRNICPLYPKSDISVSVISEECTDEKMGEEINGNFALFPGLGGRPLAARLVAYRTPYVRDDPRSKKIICGNS